MSDFDKKYNPQWFEEHIYKNWEKQGCFLPKDSTTGKSFYIPMPPPNVTSVLHVGHSVMLTLEDIMTRYHRMKGDSTLLLPGTDHAGISTQVKVEERLVKEGKDKSKMTRDEFLAECWKWNTEFGGKIQDQFRKMWTSCDWSKEKFTLDPDMNEKVVSAFNILYNKGLIYQGEYMVNYDPVLKTVVSDQEVVYREEKGKLYYITYFVSWSDSEIVVATTRPETMLGDVAVAVHPKDKRYKKLLKAGKKLILPIINKEIPLVGDEMVDMEFGTGAVKITPAHDANDFELARRHNLPLNYIVLWKDGKMTQVAWIFAGQDFMTARENIVELLRSKGNLLKIEDHSAKIWYGERTGAKIETIISKQWFVKIESLAKKVISGYKNKDFEIIPKRYNKTFEDWIYNLRDWCISRQLQWGHQIPVWYTKTWDIIVAHNENEALQKAQKMGYTGELLQDQDVLDTWFSSALWPFATLWFDMYGGEQEELFKKFYPAQVLETGHDIIFFWVIRMLLFWYEFTGQTPFYTIYFHWLVRDKIGRKMSKSLGNGVNPLDMIETYGTDALRMTLSIGNTPGNDLKFDEENVKNNAIFLNKLWNACRFVAVNIDISESFDFTATQKLLSENQNELLLHERWILGKLSELVDLVTDSMENYSFSDAGQELYTFTKNRFCDYYIEEYKLSKERSQYGEKVMQYAMGVLLKLWHPYIPFISEELYTKLGYNEMLIVSKWPDSLFPNVSEVEKNHELFVEVVREVRRLRADNNVMPNKSIKLKIYAKNQNAEILESMIPLLSWMLRSDTTEIVDKKLNDPHLVYSVVKSGVEVYVDTANALDMQAEIERLKEQILDTEDYIAILDKKLLNESFVRNAPKELVHSEMLKKEQAKQKLEKLEEKMKTMR